jgi:MFS family permease
VAHTCGKYIATALAVIGPHFSVAGEAAPSLGRYNQVMSIPNPNAATVPPKPLSTSKLDRLVSQMGLLALMQALMLCNNVTMIAINGLAGFILADNKLMATLPVTGYVLGAAVWSMPASTIMRVKGRRFGYTVGSIAAIFGSLIGWYAMQEKSLALLCFATFICGIYNAFGASLRFAAADVADTYKPSFKARAISLVLAGGIVGGIIGPEVAKWSRTALSIPFAGTYLTLVGFALASLLLAQFLRLPVLVIPASAAPPRPLREILKQPTCWAAIACMAMAFGVMNLLMVATPLAMEACKHPFAAAAFVLEWHIVGMFATGLFTGNLIQRFGILPIIVTGCLLNVACIVVALSGVEVFQFATALFLLGVGWNFMYTGGTTLLTTCYKPQEKNKVQGFADSCVFTFMVTSSASSGALLHANGWSILNWLSLPVVILIFVLMLWLASKAGWRIGQVLKAA